MSYFPDTASGIGISALTDAGVLSLTDRDALNRAGTDYSTSMAARITLMRKTPAGSRTTALPAVLTATDNDKNVVLTGTAGTLGVDGTVADGFRCYLLNTASGAATLSGISGLPSATTTVPEGAFATIFMAAATVYAEIESATGVSSGSSGATSATSYTLVESVSSGTIGTAYTVTVVPVGGNWTSSDVITFTLTGTGTASLSNGAGGTLSGNALTPPSGQATSCTVLVTPSLAGTIIVTSTNVGGLTDPSAVTYTGSASSGSGSSVSSGYPTTPSGTTLLARWDPSASGTITTGASGYPATGISQVADQNGSSNALVPGFTNPSVSTWFPTLVANEPAGLNAIGVLAGAPATGLKSTGSWLSALANGFTIYTAFVITNTPSGYTNLLQLIGSTVPGPNYSIALIGTNWYWSRWNGSANDASINGALAAAGQWNNFVLRYAGTTLDAWFNGTKVTTLISGSTIIPSQIDFGYNNENTCPFFYLGEAAVYSGAASDTDCATFASYLTSRRSSSSSSAASTGTAGTATSFAVTAAASSGTPSSALSLSLAPNGGFWPTDSITLAASGVSGSFSPATATPSAGSVAAVPVSFTPSTGGLATITATSLAGLSAPAAVYCPVFAGASGTAGTMAVTQSFGNRRPFQRDVASGNPAGFATGWNKGWGEVQLTITPSGASAGVFARLYDADSTGVTGASGTGTELTSGPVQIWGTVTAGSQSIYPNLPTSSSRTSSTGISSSAVTRPCYHGCITFAVGSVS